MSARWLGAIAGFVGGFIAAVTVVAAIPGDQSAAAFVLTLCFVPAGSVVGAEIAERVTA